MSTFQSSIGGTASTTNKKRQHKHKHKHKHSKAATVVETKFKEEPKEEDEEVDEDNKNMGYQLVNSLIKAVSKRKLNSFRYLSNYNNIHENVTTGILNTKQKHKNKHQNDDDHINNTGSMCVPVRFFSIKPRSNRDNWKWGSSASVQGVVGLANLGNSCVVNSSFQ